MSGLTLPAELAERAREGALAHAYILCGERPDALRAAADALAAAMVCRGDVPPCGECKHCQKVAKGIHPDVITVEKREDKREILVDQVRVMRRDAYIRPNEGKRKVYLIRDAHLMNEEAQNAFLKVLEDGPAYVAFLLLTPTPQALLSTVRSRCELVRVASGTWEGDPELKRKAGELAGLLLETDKWRLVTWCVDHEKDKREDAAALLEGARQAILRYRDGKTTPRAVRIAGILRELTDQLNANANVGCVLGRLWAEAGEG